MSTFPWVFLPKSHTQEGKKSTAPQQNYPKSNPKPSGKPQMRLEIDKISTSHSNSRLSQ